MALPSVVLNHDASVILPGNHRQQHMGRVALVVKKWSAPRGIGHSSQLPSFWAQQRAPGSPLGERPGEASSA